METRCAGIALWIAALCLASAGQAQSQAQVYRCVSAAGKVEYADAPCEKGARGTVVDVRPNVIESASLREQVLRLENERLKEQMRNPPAAASAPVAAATAALAVPVDPVACRQARRDYEVTASSTSNTKELIRAKESAMYSACGLREPDRQSIEVNVQPQAPPRYLIIQPPASAPRKSS